MEGSSWRRESARLAAEAWSKPSASMSRMSKELASSGVEERPWIWARRASKVAMGGPLPRSLRPTTGVGRSAPWKGRRD